MKILLAADENITLMNGAAGVVLNLEASLREMGHEVKVFTLSPTEEGSKEGDDYFFPSHPVPMYPSFRQTSVRKHPYITEVVEWKPDIIHIHTEASMARIGRYMSRKTGAPFIMTMHTYYEKFAFHRLSGTKIVNLLFRVLAAYFLRGAKVITVPSAKGERVLRSYKVKKPIYVIPNGIKLDRFQKEFSEEDKTALLSELGVSDASGVFIVISRISAEKKLDELLEFFGDVVRAEEGARLVIAGDGPVLEDLKQQVADTGLSGKVIFTGMIPQEELYKYYKSGIAFLSASDFEMHSLTYLEAIACGLPLICRNDPCLEGVLEDGVNGFAWNTREEFVSACLKFIKDKDLCRRFSDASLEISEHFGAKTCAKRMADLYAKVCKTNK